MAPRDCDFPTAGLVEHRQDPPPAGRAWTIGVVLAVALGFVMAMLDVTVVNVALGDIKQDFAAPLSDLVWIVDAYTLTFAALLLLGGSLADRIGAKRAYIAGLTLFIVASALCGLAPSTAVLVAARLLQGCGAALFMPSSLSLLTQSFPDRKTRTKLIGIWGAIVGAASGSGPFVGGVLVDHFGWRSIFYLNLPIGALGVVLTLALLRPSPRNHRSFDLVSHGFIVAALGGLSFVLIEGPGLGWFTDPSIAAAALVALGALGLFGWRERAASHPVIPRDLTANKPFLALNAMGFLVNIVIFGELFVVSLFLQQARGASAFMTGLEMLPLFGLVSVVNVFSGRYAALWGGRRVMLVGTAVAMAGALATMALGGAAPYWELVCAIMLCNFGFAFAVPAMIASVMTEAGATHSNVGAAALNANRQIGALAGVALMGILLHLVPDWTLSLRLAFLGFALSLGGFHLLVRRYVPDGRTQAPAGPVLDAH